jgi:hypothetical protein
MDSNRRQLQGTVRSNSSNKIKGTQWIAVTIVVDLCKKKNLQNAILQN